MLRRGAASGKSFRFCEVSGGSLIVRQAAAQSGQFTAQTLVLVFRPLMRCFRLLTGRFRLLMRCFRLLTGRFRLLAGRFRLLMRCFRLLTGRFRLLAGRFRLGSHFQGRRQPSPPSGIVQP
jgi:hypothetical protein